MKTYSVYILTNTYQGSLYIGVTNNLNRRIWEHKQAFFEGFTQKYNLKKLVYVEHYNSIHSALTREKQLKRWHREWKINLIQEKNPQWKDLYAIDPETSSG